VNQEQLYQELKNLAEKLDITVIEKNFRQTGINVNSGLCKVKGKNIFIMNKHHSIHNKIQILSACLGAKTHESIYVVPAVRELLNRVYPYQASQT